MSNRWLRFGIALLALGAAAAAGYRIYEQDRRLAHDVATTRAADAAAETALTTISELKAALHAYVAEGQGNAFWTARAATLIDRLRSSILELDTAASAAGIELTETLDLTDRVAASEQRAKDHVRQGQKLLAGEVIFTEARDLLDAIRLQVAHVRTAVVDTAAAAEAEVRRERTMLTLAAGGILAFATLLLVIPARGPTAVEAVPPASVPVKSTPDVDLDSSARVVSRTPLSPARPPAPAAAPVATPPPAAAGAGAPSSPGLLREAAAVCTDLGRVSRSIEMSALMERAAKVLDASGAIVWMASSDASELYPAASAGYDDRLLARIGAIARDANNVTASAMRDAAPKTSPRSGSSAAALAVPLMTPLGPVGVFTAELRNVSEVDETRLALSIIFAAQLATLLGSMATSATSTSEASNDEVAPHAAKAQA